MGKSSAFNRIVSAPAAMILAAAVTTAVSTDSVAAPARGNLTWAFCPGSPSASMNVRDARAMLARRAARNIREFERSTCVAPNGASESLSVQIPQSEERVGTLGLRFDPAASTHQHAAP